MPVNPPAIMFYIGVISPPGYTPNCRLANSYDANIAELIGGMKNKGGVPPL